MNENSNHKMINEIIFLKLNGINSRIAVQRLTALWALNECALGGLMHAFKLPFTGIFVGGISVLLITLLAFYTTRIWSTLLKALTIVLLIKASVSPYSPITSYIAVSFQAFLGILLYSVFSISKLAIVILSAITFLESGVQKLITLTIVFGQSLWEALAIYMSWIEKQFSFSPIALNSKTLVYTFLLTYFISGIAMGFLIIRTIKSLQKIHLAGMNFKLETGISELKSCKKKKKKVVLFSILLITVLLPILYFNNDSHGWQKAVYLITRSALVLIIWYTLLGPFLMKCLNKLLSKKRQFYQADISSILKILPSLKAIIYQSWKDCKPFRGLNGLSLFLAKSIAYSLYFDNTKK